MAYYDYWYICHPREIDNIHIQQQANS